ncbi:MAG: hypothetical protein ABIY70_15760 [Capsulimonas sp.]|uniref:hypothetical protein n=1 Tax=Capsulimonas sp. TaxID=2494211 RepID=UPI003266D818
MAAYHKYITDNPYRLLGISSASSPRLLRQKSIAADQAIKVGLPIPVGLASIFGEDERLNCVDIVKTLTIDITTRTLYRQLWPYSVPENEAAPGSLDDLESIALQYSNAPSFHTSQLIFLHSYFSFLISADPLPLSKGLKYWATLYQDAAHKEYLRELLIAEGENGADAQNAVVDAQNNLTKQLLKQSTKIALDTLRQGQDSIFQALIQAIYTNDLEQEIVNRTLTETLVSVGERDRAAIQGRIERTREALCEQRWTPEWAAFDPDEIRELKALSEALAGRHPSAVIWRKTVVERIDQIATAMNQYAVDLFDESGDAEGSMTILSQAQALSTSAKLRSEIALNLDIIKRAVHVDTTPQHPKPQPASPENPKKWRKSKSPKQRTNRLNPVDRIPVRFTLIGCGSKLRQEGPYEVRPAWRYATLYITLLFIPVMPIQRYVISDMSPSGCVFQGYAPFSPWHKLHLTFGLALLLWGIIAVGQASNSAASIPGNLSP